MRSLQVKQMMEDLAKVVVDSKEDASAPTGELGFPTWLFFCWGGSRESSGVCRILGVKQDKTRSSLVEVGISPWFVFFFPGGIIELEFHDDFRMDDHITVVLINCRRTQRSSLQMVNCMISITNGSVTDGAEPPKQIENSRPVI